MDGIVILFFVNFYVPILLCWKCCGGVGWGNLEKKALNVMAHEWQHESDMRSFLRLTFNLIVFPSNSHAPQKSSSVLISIFFFIRSCRVSSQISLHGTHIIPNSVSWLLISIPESCSMKDPNGFHFTFSTSMSHVLSNKIRRQNNLPMSKTLAESKIVPKKWNETKRHIYSNTANTCSKMYSTFKH